MKTLAARAVLLGLLAAAPRASAGLLSAGSVAVLDSNGAVRATFTNNERITFQQRVYNGVASGNRIVFTFNVLSPSGAQVFSIVGNAATQLSGFPVSKFYAGPGVYTLQAQAALDGQTATQTTTFVVSSPNILLLYPPNGAQNIADVPLTFRWVSSGGSKYKVTVGDNPSFYNALFTQQTSGGETSLSYPVNPSDPRLVLSAGQMYYWKVEALDAGGAVVGASASPFSFSVQTAALSRDMAIIDVAAAGAPDAQGAIPFKVTVKNQGGTAQGNVPLRFSVGGLAAAGTPLTMTVLSPGETHDYSFSAPLPPGQSQSLAIACVEFSDDNLPNNCKTLMVSQPTLAAGGTSDFGGEMTPDQVWQAVQTLLRQQGTDLGEYNLVGMEGKLSGDELKSLLDSLKTGGAEIALSGLPPAFTPPSLSTSSAASAAAPSASSPRGPDFMAPSGVVAEEEPMSPLGTEWTGLAAPLSTKMTGIKISDEKAWKKLWRQLRSERLPRVDFTQHMVVGVLAGREDKNDHAEIEAAEMSLSGLVVRYKMVSYATFNVHKAPRTTVPYRLRVIPRTSVPIQFERIEEPEEGKSKPQEKK